MLYRAKFPFNYIKKKHGAKATHKAGNRKGRKQRNKESLDDSRSKTEESPNPFDVEESVLFNVKKKMGSVTLKTHTLHPHATQ